jgi:hemerythrin-like domain-containing protein
VRGIEIRERVQADHQILRSMLDDIEEYSQRFERGEFVGETLREQGLALYECFSAHLELEETILAPALRLAGAAGERIAARLKHEHHEQRELIRYLLGRIDRDSAPTLLVARELRHFAEYLRFDMQYEESTMLTDEILIRDDAAADLDGA